MQLLATGLETTGQGTTQAPFLLLKHTPTSCGTRATVYIMYYQQPHTHGNTCAILYMFYTSQQHTIYTVKKEH
jgi:hypothetical protein